MQLYATDEVASVVRPYRQLVGFARVPLEPGASCDVTFTGNSTASIQGQIVSGRTVKFASGSNITYKPIYIPGISPNGFAETGLRLPEGAASKKSASSTVIARPRATMSLRSGRICGGRNCCRSWS